MDSATTTVARCIVRVGISTKTTLSKYFILFPFAYRNRNKKKTPNVFQKRNWNLKLITKAVERSKRSRSKSDLSTHLYLHIVVTVEWSCTVDYKSTNNNIIYSTLVKYLFGFLHNNKQSNRVVSDFYIFTFTIITVYLLGKIKSQFEKCIIFRTHFINIFIVLQHR